MGHSLLFISTMSQLFGILRPYPTYSFPFYKSWRKLLPTTDSHLLIFQICICKTCSNCVAIYTLLAVLWPTIKKLFYLSYLHCLYINIKNIIICKGIQILMIKSYKNALPVHPLSISSFSSFPSLPHSTTRIHFFICLSLPQNCATTKFLDEMDKVFISLAPAVSLSWWNTLFACASVTPYCPNLPSASQVFILFSLCISIPTPCYKVTVLQGLVLD